MFRKCLTLHHKTKTKRFSNSLKFFIMGTFTEQINEVKDARMSCKAKYDALVKLGVRPIEARTLLNMWTVKTEAGKFTTTFGVEMETINCPRMVFLSAARRNGLEVENVSLYDRRVHRDVPRFKLVPDSSIMGVDPAECVTPALKSNKAGFKSLEACCKALAETGATVNGSCGLHVHIGAAGLTEQEYCNVFLNYQRLEQAIDSFMAPSRRGDHSRWCRSVRRYDLESCNTRMQVYRRLNGDRSDPNSMMKSATARGEQSKELAYRVGIVNKICKEYGIKNCVYVSIHVNAAGGGGKWHDAWGFSVFVSPNASANSRLLAQLFLKEAISMKLIGNRYIPSRGYWESNLYVCRNTLCPAVLTENLFQDNKEDVDFLLSDEGRQAIVDLHRKAIEDYINGD